MNHSRGLPLLLLDEALMDAQIIPDLIWYFNMSANSYVWLGVQEKDGMKLKVVFRFPTPLLLQWWILKYLHLQAPHHFTEENPLFYSWNLPYQVRDSQQVSRSFYLTFTVKFLQNANQSNPSALKDLNYSYDFYRSQKVNQFSHLKLLFPASHSYTTIPNFQPLE